MVLVSDFKRISQLVLFLFVWNVSFSQDLHPLINPAQPMIDLIQHDTTNGVVDFRIRWGHGPATGDNTIPIISGLSIDDLSVVGPTKGSYSIQEVGDSWEDGGTIESIALKHDVGTINYYSKYRVFRGKIRYDNYSGPISIQLPSSSFTYDDYSSFPLGGTSYDLPLISTSGGVNVDSNTLNVNLELELTFPWRFSLNKAHLVEDLEVTYNTNLNDNTTLIATFDGTNRFEFLIRKGQGTFILPKSILENLQEFGRYDFKILKDSNVLLQTDHLYYLPNHEIFHFFEGSAQIEHLRSSNVISQNTPLSLIWVGKNNMPTDHEDQRAWRQSISITGHGYFLNKIKGKYRGNGNRIVPEVIDGLTFNREQAGKNVYARIAEFTMHTPEYLDSLYPSDKYNYEYNPIKTWRGIVRGNSMTFHLYNSYSVSTGFQRKIEMPMILMELHLFGLIAQISTN